MVYRKKDPKKSSCRMKYHVLGLQAFASAYIGLKTVFRLYNQRNVITNANCFSEICGKNHFIFMTRMRLHLFNWPVGFILSLWLVSFASWTYVLCCFDRSDDFILINKEIWSVALLLHDEKRFCSFYNQPELAYVHSDHLQRIN